MECLWAVVNGRVQGVGFRYFVQKQAKSMGLRGWVRNLPDGTVETLAFGPKKTLERFLQELKTGPIGSRVDGCEFQWSEGQKPLSDFEIRS